MQCFGGAKNHMIVMPDADMDQAVDALIGAGYGSAGERCMAVSVAVPVGQKTADTLVKKLIPRVEALKIGTSMDSQADYGPMVTKELLGKVRGYIDSGVKEGAKLVVDGRNFKLQGYENGNFIGGCLFDEVTPDMKIYKEEIFGPVLSVVRAKDYEEAVRLPSEHEYGNGVAIFTRDGDTARDFTQRVQCRHGRRQLRDPGAARLLHVRRLEALRLRRPQSARAGFDPLLHQDQNRDLALAVGHQGRGRVLHSDHEMSATRTTLAQCGSAALLAASLGACAGTMSGALTDVQPAPKLDMNGRWLLSAKTSPPCGMAFQSIGGRTEWLDHAGGRLPGRLFQKPDLVVRDRRPGHSKSGQRTARSIAFCRRTI